MKNYLDVNRFSSNKSDHKFKNIYISGVYVNNYIKSKIRIV